LLETQEAELDKFRLKVATAADKHAYLRCAAPFKDWLTRVFDPPEFPQIPILILASDGSQINPDRHNAVEFGLVNVGLIKMVANSQIVPEVWTQSKLYYLGTKGLEDGGLSEDFIALQRDVRERCFLSEKAIEEQREMAKTHQGELLPVVALSDGPIELFGEHRSISGTNYSIERYLAALKQLGDTGAVLGGYVDKPRADLVVRMLEVGNLSDDELSKKELPRKFQRITDAALFADRLKPGQRTGVFELISRSAKQYSKKPGLGLHFFYINVGTVNKNGEQRNLFARIEVPKWVAESKEKLDLLHATLLQQCQILGTQPYPYVLHRAHEVALVRFAEQEELNRMIAVELLSRGFSMGEDSQKSENKGSMSSQRRY